MFPLAKYKNDILFLLAAIAISVGCERDQPALLKEGDVFPLATLDELKAIDDSKTDYKNKTLVINFWATWCPPCREEMPDLQQLSDSVDKSKFAVIGISVDDDINLMKEFLLHNDIRFSNYQDKNKRFSRDLLGINAYPETFIITPGGIIIKRILGEQRWNSKAMHELLHSVHKGEKSRLGGWAFG